MNPDFHQAATKELNSWETKHSATLFSQNRAAFRLYRWDCWCASAAFTRSRISTLTSICIHTPSADHSRLIVTSMSGNYSLHHLWLFVTSVIKIFWFFLVFLHFIWLFWRTKRLGREQKIIIQQSRLWVCVNFLFTFFLNNLSKHYWCHGYLCWFYVFLKTKIKSFWWAAAFQSAVKVFAFGFKVSPGWWHLQCNCNAVNWYNTNIWLS